MNVASAIIAGTEVKLHRPLLPVLSCFLGCFWSIKTTLSTRLRSLPDACAGLIIETVDGAALRCFFTGPRLAPVERTPQPGQIFCGVRLKPGVAFLLTGVPMYKLVGRRVMLSDLLGIEALQLQRCLERARSLNKRLNFLESFLFDRLFEMQIDPIVQDAINRIENSNGEIRIAQLSKQCKVSARHLNRLLRDWVGFSPKRLARIVRFQGLLKRMETLPGPGSAELAAQLGYFDQAHSVNEVTELAGASPSRIGPGGGVSDFSKTRCG